MSRGFTLVELLLVIAMLAMLYALGTPALQPLVDNSRLSSQVALYTQALHTARVIAVQSGRGVTLCRLDAGGRCTGQWQGELSLFHDTRREGRLAADTDLIMRLVPPADSDVSVAWRGFGERRFLHVRGLGTYRQNGRFTFCPRHGREGVAGRSIVVNVTGRTRIERLDCG